MSSGDSESDDFLSAGEGSDIENEKSKSNQTKFKYPDSTLKNENLSKSANPDPNKETICLLESQTSNLRGNNNDIEGKDSKIKDDSKEENVTKEISEDKSIKEVESQIKSYDGVKEKCNETKPTTKKSIKESKIGLKKPREKLGTRINKPLIGISSDSIKADNIITEQPIAREEKTSENLKINESNETSTWSSWNSWGSSLASAASNLTREISKVVEDSIGAPDPEIIAKENAEMEKRMKELSLTNCEDKNLDNQVMNETETKSDFLSFGFGQLGMIGSFVSGVSGALESAGTTVLQGGLDTLEKIGRKTMDVIQDGDPGLRRKRAFLKSKSNNLSLVLKEARQRAMEEEENRLHESGSIDEVAGGGRNVSLSSIWSGSEGAAHLEALRLISKQSQAKTGILMKELPLIGFNKVQPLMLDIKNCCEIDEEEYEDISKELGRITRDIPLPLKFGKILTNWPSLESTLSRMSIEIQGYGNDEAVDYFVGLQKDLYSAVVQVLSEVIAVIHKAAELSLITPDFDCVSLAQKFRELCSCMSSGLEKSADSICESITRSVSDQSVNDIVTNIYVQMSEANSYIQNALQLLTSILVQIQVKQTLSEFL